MNRLSVLERLRETYRTGTADDLQRQFNALNYFLLPVDKEKVLEALRLKRLRDETVKKAIMILGGELLDKR